MSALEELRDRGLIAADWADALAEVDDTIGELVTFLQKEEAAGRGYLPQADQVFRAFSRPMAEVKVLIVGQDPYPTPGHPVGLAFSVAGDVRPLPASLRNIYKELSSDIGVPAPPHGDLTAWSEQGVMLLNRALTVRPGTPGSHRGLGWEQVTEHAIRALAQRDEPLVAVLWGADARKLAPLLGGARTVESPHPSPLSVWRGGFFDSRPFSRVNELLREQGADPVDWRLN